MREGRRLPDRQAPPQAAEGKKEEPVVKGGVAAGGAVGVATTLMALTDVMGWTTFTPDDKLTIVAAVGIVSPVVAALVARMHVWARPKG